MLLEGEIKGAGAADLVRLFLEITNPSEIFSYIPKFMNVSQSQKTFVPTESTLQLTKQFGGISAMELTCGAARIEITVDANRAKPAYVHYSTTSDEGEVLRYCVQSYSSIREKSRDLLMVVERACY